MGVEYEMAEETAQRCQAELPCYRMVPRIDQLRHEKDQGGNSAKIVEPELASSSQNKSAANQSDH